MRERPLRERKPKKRIEEDAALRQAAIADIPVPEGSKEFREGYRDCLETYAMHAPNRRYVAKILDDACVLLEQECLRTNMARENLARYEGYRQAIKDLSARRKI